MNLRLLILSTCLMLFSSISHAQDRYIPNDPLFKNQWWADNTGQPYYIPLAIIENEAFMLEFVGIPDVDVDLPEAWAIEKGNKNCVIAILDLGFQLDHPDLSNQFLENGWNALRKDSVLNTGDDHGTSVAGIAAGNMDNNIGIAGVAPGCKILPIIVTTSRDSRSNKSKTEFPLSEGIRYAINNNATVISISIVVPTIKEIIENLAEEPSEDALKSISSTRQSIIDSLSLAVDEAYAANIPIVAGSGNIKTDEKMFPAAFEKVISVTSVNNRGEISPFATIGDWVNVAAPGESVLTCAITWKAQSILPCPIDEICINHEDYCHPDGTSYSTPIVAGIVALLKSHYPNITIEEIRQTLIRTGKPNTSDSKLPPIVSAGNALKNPVRFNSEVLMTGK